MTERVSARGVIFNAKVIPPALAEPIRRGPAYAAGGGGELYNLGPVAAGGREPMAALTGHKEGDRAMRVGSSSGWNCRLTLTPRNPGVTPPEKRIGVCRVKSLNGMVGRE
jgi:hypothetical protein